eukprot:9264602-Prorocentrum_lima.AAC.1
MLKIQPAVLRNLAWEIKKKRTNCKGAPKKKIKETTSCTLIKDPRILSRLHETRERPSEQVLKE